MAVDSANNLITLSTLLTFCGLASDDSDYTDLLNQAIDGASWFLNSKTRRKLKARDLTEYYDGDGTPKLMLEQRPINAMSSIYSDPDRDFAAASLVDSDDYQTYGDEGFIIFTSTAVAVGSRVLKVTYNGGYSTVPYDLQQACIELAAITYENYKSHRTQLKSVSSDAGTQSFEHGVPPFVKEVIAQYKKHWVL